MGISRFVCIAQSCFFKRSPGFTANDTTVYWYEHFESRWPVVIILNDINISARVLHKDLEHFTPNKKNGEV